ncbi:MAG: NAD(P)/FAD-dependent oxidoreductase [Acidimicrobiales bacterium]
MAAGEHGETDYRQCSFWMDSLGEAILPRPAVSCDLESDVAIVGGGYTGLWTAYYLSQLAPGTRIVVVEGEVVGYGASGRNGGWCSGLFAASHARLARDFGMDAMHSMRHAMNDTVDEVGRVAARESIDCHFQKAGTLTSGRSKAQVASLREELAQARRLGIGEEDLAWCEQDELSALFTASGVRGGLFTPHCARIHPALLARGLASALERRGVAIYEQSEVLRVLPGPRPVLETVAGRVTADSAVIATEGYTSRLAGHEQEIVPVYSLMVATEPLGPDAVISLGSALARGATFTDGRHLIIYGQVTADGRLAFGGRGAPYHFGSAIREGFDRDPRVHASLEATIAELFPQLAPVHITHRWGGPIGVHRDWFPSVSLDRRTGIASAGGYVGDGVGTANLAGRTLADLILGRSTDLVLLPWVGHESPAWESEPWRWLGVNTGLALMQAADVLESRTGRPSRLARAVGRFTGN